MTLENNRLIAEFMGANAVPDDIDFVRFSYDMFGIIESINDGPNEKHFYSPEEMLFHISWDWLMPVVDRIHDVIGDDDSVAEPEYFDAVMEAAGPDGKTEHLYKAVVDFILWYNALPPVMGSFDANGDTI